HNQPPNCCSAALRKRHMPTNLDHLVALKFAPLNLVFGTAFSQAGTCSGMSLGQGASLNGFVPFQSTSLWNTDISNAPVDPNSANYINFIGSTVTLHPDFGAGTFHNQTIG